MRSSFSKLRIAGASPSIRPSGMPAALTLARSLFPAAALEKPPRVAIADGSSGVESRISDMLKDAGYEVVVRSIRDHYELLKSDAVDLLLIDMNLPTGTGFELCGELRATEAWSRTPIILLSSIPADEGVIVRGLMCGADDCLTSIDGADRLAELQARVRVQLRNKRERDRLQRVREERDTYFRAAAVDTLTGVATRRALDQAMRRAFGEGAPFAIMFLDVDHFKRVNDELGHPVGDEVLHCIGRSLKATARPQDIVGRFGGEEFVVICPGVDAAQGVNLAEQHRTAIAALEIPRLGRQVTASFGVAMFEPGGQDADVESLCARADAALYASKKSGRNRVTLAGTNVHTDIASEAPVHDPLSALAGAEEMLLKELKTGRAGLPLLPASAAEALRLAEDPRTSMSQIAHLVDHDPPLAARFVALASSAAFGRGARVSSTQAALVRLGLAVSRDLLLRAAYERSNGELPKYQELVTQSFAKSVRMAVIAQKIVRFLTPNKFDLAYLCALLHDIGEARIYRVLASMAVEFDPAVVANLVARHHMQAGADVARAWRLPTAIVEACAAHHGPAQGAPISVRIVMAAESLVRLIDGEDQEPAALEANEDFKLAVSLGLKETQLPELIRVWRAELAEMAEGDAIG